MSARAVIAGLGVVASLGFGATSWAQSKRYPPAPIDKDAEQAARSDLWNAAVTPERHPYLDLVRLAAEALGRHTPDQTLEAIKRLDEAVRLLPHEAEAYRLRGEAQFDRHAWAACASDYAAAEAYTQRDERPAKAMAELHRKLGLCQARAGKLNDAEKTLAETAISANSSGEVWMRLGEVRLAMGKLDEAIVALRAALEVTEPQSQALIRFMLAAAYDRAPRPADESLEAKAAAQLDRSLATLRSPAIPPVDPAELDYMFALAHIADPARPEYRPEHALVHFRRFMLAAPTSPWRRRAEDHIRALKAVELPDVVRRDGPAPPDVATLRAAIHKMMPQLRGCLASRPDISVEVELTRAGPRTPSSDPNRARFLTPAEGAAVHPAIGELSPPQLEAIDRCLQPLLARLGLPILRELDTYYKVAFFVLAP